MEVALNRFPMTRTIGSLAISRGADKGRTIVRGEFSARACPFMNFPRTVKVVVLSAFNWLELQRRLFEDRFRWMKVTSPTR